MNLRFFLALIIAFTSSSLFAQDAVPCEEPYPQVTDLAVEITENGVQLSYTPVAGALACRLRLKKTSPADSPVLKALDTLPDLGSYTIPSGVLEYQNNYLVSVSCGCSEDTVIFGSFSTPVLFSSGTLGTIPCETPYPKVEGLSSSPTDNLDGIGLSWQPIPQSLVCQVSFSSDDIPAQAVIINGFEESELVLPDSVLFQNSNYSWRVRCGCQWDPRIVGPWSARSYFNSGDVGTLDGFAPLARFRAGPLSPVQGTTIAFRDQSFYEPNSWLWDFGDGTTSTLQNPTHLYTEPGIYTVSLTAANSLGSATETREEYIQVFAPNCPSSVTDIDGNEYSVVQLGNTCWTGENSLATSFNNGDAIPNVEPTNSWSGFTSPAYCNYNNDEVLGDTIGRLYNGYVLLDERNVCPTGWHIPVESEWLALEDLVGMDMDQLNTTGSARGRNRNVGGQLKSTMYWAPLNYGGSDLYGLSILPVGYRLPQFLDFIRAQSASRFSAVNDLAVGPLLWYREFVGLSRGITREEALPSFGHPIRCVQD